MSNLSSSCTAAETAKAVTAQAARQKYVLRMARCWSSPGARAALNDGQNNHRNTVPESMEEIKTGITRMYSSRMRIARSLTVSHCIRKN